MSKLRKEPPSMLVSLVVFAAFAEYDAGELINCLTFVKSSTTMWIVSPTTVISASGRSFLMLAMVVAILISGCATVVANDGAVAVNNIVIARTKERKFFI